MFHYTNKEQTLTLNPRLSSLCFQKVKDPYSTYLELERYLSNKANPMKPIPEMPDTVKIQSHGFDEKSFRKAPERGKLK